MEEEILTFTVNSERQIKHLKKQLKEQNIKTKVLFLLSEDGIPLKLEKVHLSEDYEQKFDEIISKKLDLSDVGK